MADAGPCVWSHALSFPARVPVSDLLIDVTWTFTGSSKEMTGDSSVLNFLSSISSVCHLVSFLNGWIEQWVAR